MASGGTSRRINTGNGILTIGHVRHLDLFFEKAAADKAFNPTHLSLYIALFQCWNLNNFKNPVSISREELMRVSEINSKATYHKCLKTLHCGGYIKYEPSYNSFKGSHFHLLIFQK